MIPISPPDAARALIAAVLIASVTGFDSQPLRTDPLATPEFVQWALREGGAFLVILIVLYFYRRDWKTTSGYWKDQNDRASVLLARTIESMTDVGAAVRENTVVMHRLTRIVEMSLVQTGRPPLP